MPQSWLYSIRTQTCFCVSFGFWPVPFLLAESLDPAVTLQVFAHFSVVPAGAPGQLLKGLDSNKDQSYFLASVPAQALQHFMFPLGELTKTHVRALAVKAGLISAARRSSAGVCFIGECGCAVEELLVYPLLHVQRLLDSNFEFAVNVGGCLHMVPVMLSSDMCLRHSNNGDC